MLMGDEQKVENYLMNIGYLPIFILFTKIPKVIWF